MKKKYDEETAWWCVACHSSGIVEYPKGESVYSVIALLEHAHNNHELALHFDCMFKDGQVRVTQVPK